MTNDAERQRWTVLFSGRVQGVGFRYTTQQTAAGYEVGGYVRNLPDGRVEMVAQGAASELERFLAGIQAAMAGHIRDQSIDRSAGTGEFRSFDIRH